ncbi:hypothetical protein QBC40DRAFT_179567 [Triangularia verruculosa]|uniref:Uncharacterized protein n=1 Tax=Triangularia verruculosa TaxID=2587418 RepID=A0AAN6XCN6_9PEZI|nr:hypothetical protein QBC40DRAFT_179567 [Triangularia verruculosa]
MSLKVYRDQILEPVVGQWLREGHSFVLEEDNDSGHGGGGPKKNRLDHYFNSSHSPDFVPIEKAWAYTKREVRKRQCWDDETVKGLAEEGWAKLSQKRINKWVDQIPQILEDCIELEGALTGH